MTTWLTFPLARWLLADCCVVPQVFNARRFDLDLAPFPTLVRIAEHCEALPAFIAAHPAQQPDAA